MFKILSAVIFIGLLNFSTPAQNPNPNYRIYDAGGNGATLQSLIAAFEKSDVVFLGENHDDATAHVLQTQIFKMIWEDYAKTRKIALSLEMFERDTQIVLNEYLDDLITEKKFLDDSRPWNNYPTDYRPLIEFAKENKLPVIAANAPRRYVNMVSRGGRAALERLTPDAKRWLAPLPYPAASIEYAKKFNSLMGGVKSETSAPTKILEAQALWDATMAFSVAEVLKRDKNSLIVHINGGFHTENRLGIVEQLHKLQPNAKIIVVTMRTEDDYTKFDQAKHQDLGDFVVLTDAKVPRSFK